MKAQLSDLVRGYWNRRRREPYTEAGIRRLKCIRCAEPARFQWSICADGNNHRPLCGRCDVDLNRMVLRWMLHPSAEELADRYERQKAASTPASPAG